eukprot:scaffold56007_cov65-Phaeocystis_antarctica.AAC.2
MAVRHSWPHGRKVLPEDVEWHAPAVFVSLMHDKVWPLVLERSVEFAQACERAQSSSKTIQAVSGAPAGFRTIPREEVALRGCSRQGSNV